jgi:hypothetical protein
MGVSDEYIDGIQQGFLKNHCVCAVLQAIILAAY